MEVDLQEMVGKADILGGLLRGIQELDADDPLLASLANQFSDLYRKLPAELRSGEDTIDLESPQYLRTTVERAKHLLLSRLLSSKDTE